jgi:hypothetical protein
MISIEQAFSNFTNLSQAEKIEFLTMIMEHKTLLHKVLPDAPFITYLVTGQGPEDNPMIQAYQAWVGSLLTRTL